MGTNYIGLVALTWKEEIFKSIAFVIKLQTHGQQIKQLLRKNIILTQN